MRRQILGLVMAAAIPAAALAAEPEKTDKPKDVFNREFGLPGLLPPDNLAASSLGIGPDDVQQIRNLSGLQTGLLGGIGRDGKLKGGFGLGFSPFALGVSIDADAYATNPFDAMVARTRFSVAISQAETDGKDGAIAIGAQTVLFDRGDTYTRGFGGGGGGASVFERSAVGACWIALTQAEAASAPPPPPPKEGEEDKPLPTFLVDGFVKCRTQQKKATWNDASLGVGVATVARAGGNSVTRISNSNNIVYATASYGFDWLDGADELSVGPTGLKSGCDKGFHLSCNAQLVFAAKYQSDAAFETKDRGPQTGRSYGWGAKLVAGTDRSVLYGFYREENVHFSFAKRDLHEYGAGFETKLGEKLWAHVVIGRKDDDILGQETTAKATLSWDWTETPTLSNLFR
jgi:hypothetical protein